MSSPSNQQNINFSLFTGILGVMIERSGYARLASTPHRSITTLALALLRAYALAAKSRRSRFGINIHQRIVCEPKGTLGGGFEREPVPRNSDLCLAAGRATLATSNLGQ